jgi:exopolysaccharide biosynthesis polyprenyl glycosylphosphotransferase
MFPSRQIGINRLYFLLQQAGVLLLLWILYPAINIIVYDSTLPSRDYVEASLILLAAAVAERFTRYVPFRQIAGLTPQQLTAVSHRQTLFALVSIFGAMVMLKDDGLSRIFLAAYFGAYFGWISWSNRFGFRILHRSLYRSPSKGLSRAVLIGSPNEVRRYCSDSRPFQPPGTDILGVVTTIGDGATLKNDLALPLLGQLSDLRSICEGIRADALLLLGLGDRKDLIRPLSALTSELGLRTMWIDDIGAHYGSKCQGWHDRNYSVVSQLREPLEDPVNRAIKRGIDLLGSTLGIILLLPPALLVVAVIHRLHSPGPLFYRQQRSGRNGEPFEVLKFRSMQIEKVGTFRQATRNDSRVFAGGNFLRRSSIDELPQLINVFFGQMSLVGPRPHPLSMDDRMAPEAVQYRLRHLAKPGITGLAQCRGWRGETRLPNQLRNRIRMDLFYIQHWSLLLDFRILLETCTQVVRPPKSAF